MQDVRKEESEVHADSTINFEFEKEMLDKDKLRELFLEEIEYYKNYRKEGK